MPRLGLVTLLVRAYDEAIAFYVGRLGFDLAEDTALPAGKRWVVVRPRGEAGAGAGAGAGILLARAVGAEQSRAVGAQSGGRVFLFLETDDFRRDHDAFRSNGVAFEEPPRREAYGTVAVFRDLYGNRWDLVEPSPTAGTGEADDQGPHAGVSAEAGA